MPNRDQVLFDLIPRHGKKLNGGNDPDWVVIGQEIKKKMT